MNPMHALRYRAALALGLLALGCATEKGQSGGPGAASASAAQQAPSTPPVVDGDVTTAMVNGVQVIVKKIPGAELAAGQLYIRGGARNWGADNAGVEQLAVSVAASGGTHHLDKDAFTRRLAALGSRIGATSESDFSAFSCKGLRSAWDDTFQLLADAFLDPALPPSEIELKRQRQLAGLHEEQEDPDSRLALLMHKMLFAGHPFANRAVGTLETVPRLTAADLAAQLKKLRETRRLLFVAVGDLDAQHVMDEVRSTFGTLPPGDYQESPLPPISFSAPRLVSDAMQIPTNYIAADFPGPRWSDADFAAGLVTMNALQWRLFQEVRTKRNLSYAPGAHLSTHTSVPVGQLYVTAVDPTTTMGVMLGEAKRLAAEPLPAKDLAGTKSTFLTGYLMGSESTDGQAGMLALCQLYAGDWKMARQLPDRIRAVTASEAQTFAKRIVNLQTGIVGAPAKLSAGLLF